MNSIEFRLDYVEANAMNNFEAEHKHASKYTGAIGGTLTYSFTPTSLGTVIKVKCSFCVIEKDITNYDIW